MECRRGAREATLLVLPFWATRERTRKVHAIPNWCWVYASIKTNMYRVYASIKHVCIGSTPQTRMYRTKFALCFATWLRLDYLTTTWLLDCDLTTWLDDLTTTWILDLTTWLRLVYDLTTTWLRLDYDLTTTWLLWPVAGRMSWSGKFTPLT